ncbi:hypothetical protein [Neptuniibacter marinus]|uniref:hypothetical protein n=1 Tax=Neptuniibacter marinus TaxID=1806670 RepID=UPI003B59961B
MKPDEWWKNFGLGMELDASGTFIYNGIKSLDSLEGLNHSVDIFEILYSLSVGIERLLKVAIILIEHDDSISIEEFEESLITHNTTELANRLQKNQGIGLSAVHKEFLALLSKFYKSHRYVRFSLSSVPNITEEKDLFLSYLHKHLGINISDKGHFSYIHNTTQIKKFIGKIVGKISKNLFRIIGKRARSLNLYTYELRSDSKAIKVFYSLGDRLDFLEEEIVKKELILHLISKDISGDHIDFLRSIAALNLDSDETPTHIKALLNDVHLHLVKGEVECEYEEIENVKDRLQLLDLMTNEL